MHTITVPLQNLTENTILAIQQVRFVCIRVKIILAKMYTCHTGHISQKSVLQLAFLFDISFFIEYNIDISKEETLWTC